MITLPHSYSKLPESKDILDLALSAVLIIPIAPRESQEPQITQSSARSTRSVACPRATSDLTKNEITWERIDKVSKSLPNPLTMLFSMGD